MPEVLRVKDLHAWYGESHVLHGVDFAVNKGEVVTLLGRNGAGRTSTLKSILGLVGRRTGSIVVNGVETVGLPTYKIAHLGIGYCPEERGIFSSLSVEENLTLPPESLVPCAVFLRSPRLGNMSKISSTLMPPSPICGGSIRFSSTDRLEKMPRSSGQ